MAGAVRGDKGMNGGRVRVGVRIERGSGRGGRLNAKASGETRR